MTTLGKANISQTTIDIITSLSHHVGTILEFGSGAGTQILADMDFEMISIEHSEEWIDRFDSKYIHAPIRTMKPTKQFPLHDHWYHPTIIERQLASIGHNYDLILVDGPPRFVGDLRVGRAGFFKYRSMFNLKVPIIFDDTHRETEAKLAMHIARRLDCPVIQYDTNVRKVASILPADRYDFSVVKEVLYG